MSPLWALETRKNMYKYVKTCRNMLKHLNLELLAWMPRSRALLFTSYGDSYNYSYDYSYNYRCNYRSTDG